MRRRSIHANPCLRYCRAATLAVGRDHTSTGGGFSTRVGADGGEKDSGIDALGGAIDCIGKGGEPIKPRCCMTIKIPPATISAINMPIPMTRLVTVAHYAFTAQPEQHPILLLRQRRIHPSPQNL